MLTTLRDTQEYILGKPPVGANTGGFPPQTTIGKTPYHEAFWDADGDNAHADPIEVHI